MTRILSCACLIWCALASQAFAANEIARTTLANGAVVSLKDDFTWEYVITQAIEAPAARRPAEPMMPTAPLMPEVTAVAAKPEMPAGEQLTAQAMSHGAMLGHTAKDGIGVSFERAQWLGDELGLVFTLTSSSKEHVIGVEVEAGFFDDQGMRIKQEKLEVWRAITRVPETYLRNGQTRQSQVFWVEGISQAQWRKQHLSLKITEIETR
ncbi:DUF3157 family protein [Shewanella salipaludis]|uniref:DUF3157 family protein n=1 Tax=Shewanella salipaludis TaxID=2723052 RepID=A0A972FUY0_9GAMM|nr:DUF3157 family protein [Shewanella salipaludis]NMH66221.1 DUF3157 family protein [Shewanella salipaludis]